MIKNALEDEKLEIPLSQIRRSAIDSPIEVAQRKIIKMNLRNNISKKRILNVPIMGTLPFGYDKMLKSDIENSANRN